MKKISRRSFLAAAGVSAAALALTACGGSSNSTAASTAPASSTAASAAAGDAAAAASDPKVTLSTLKSTRWTPSLPDRYPLQGEGRGTDWRFRCHRRAGFRCSGL